MKQDKRSRAVMIGSIGALMVIVIGVVAWRARANRAPAIDESSPDAFRQLVTSDTFQKLSEEEQQKTVRTMAMGHRQRMLDEYFALAEGRARQDYLDKRIDEHEEMRKLIENPSTQPSDGRIMIRRGGPSASAQKEMTETIPAEYQGKMAQYMKDLRDRRAARGLPTDGPGGGAFIMRIGGPK